MGTPDWLHAVAASAELRAVLGCHQAWGAVLHGALPLYDGARLAAGLAAGGHPIRQVPARPGLEACSGSGVLPAGLLLPPLELRTWCADRLQQRIEY